MKRKSRWPVLREYDADHLLRIALPLGGIGTGTVSLGGRGDLRDWEVMNRPAKGYVPGARFGGKPFFALYAKPAGGEAVTRALEGPLDLSEYEGASGSPAPNHGLPRFRDCSFSAAYPLGQVELADPQVPVKVRLEAFNPFIPGDANASGIPIAVLRYVLENRTGKTVSASICGSLPNFIGEDGSEGECRGNRNRYKEGKGFRGICMDSRGVDEKAAQWGTMALATTTRGKVSHRTAWLDAGWGTSMLDFWDDFSGDGMLAERKKAGVDAPMASLAVQVKLKPRERREAVFLLAWHFPNRITWTPAGNEEDIIGNYYAAQYRDAWDVLGKTVPKLKRLEERTVEFVEVFCGSDLPGVVKEAALFNLSTLRTQTCFRTPDGNFYGWEGCNDESGCCMGSCTHVWNYEQATAFLFGDLAQRMRRVEFLHATRDDGMMSFRVNLPLSRAQGFGKAAADGQMGCVMKAYRDWQLSGDDDFLKALLPQVKRAIEFCWIRGGWDADRDGVMEGCQHNTMDVEYFGPNPQMGIWYLGALRAAEEMCRYAREDDFAECCRELFAKGRAWIDAELFNGEYYEHEIRPPKREADVAESLRLGAGAKDLTDPDYQLGAGCLVDQLIGQLLAHVCGLGYLVEPMNARRTLRSIVRYNRSRGLRDHFNCMRSYALGEESALLMASYPKERPANPFPYFTEVMTGFEYTAAIGLLYEGMTDAGLRSMRDIRDRYDGAKRNPFDEAECGHHYARAMVTWAAVNVLAGFHYSGVEKRMTFAAKEGNFFWANGRAWGTCRIGNIKEGMIVELKVLFGELFLREFALEGAGVERFTRPVRITAGKGRRFTVGAK